MVPLNGDLNYEPKQEIIHLWKYTYSIPTLYEGVTLPGLIKTNYFYLHFLAFVIVVAGEIFGLEMITNIQPDYKFIFFGMLLIDFTLLFPILLLNGKLKLIKNKIIITPADDELNRVQLRSGANTARLFLFMCKCILFFFAMIKVYYLFNANFIPHIGQEPKLLDIVATGIAKVELLPMVAIYILVAIIHAFFSSYFWGHIYLAFRLKYGKSGEKARENIEEYRTVLLPAHLSFNEAGVKSGRERHHITLQITDEGHKKIIIDNNEETKSRYKLHTWGLLTDEQLDRLVWSQQSREAKRELALICLQHQLGEMGV